jgi:hypothetical protein
VLAVARFSKCYTSSVDLSKRLLHNHVSIQEREHETDTLQRIFFPVTKRLAETMVLMPYVKFCHYNARIENKLNGPSTKNTFKELPSIRKGKISKNGFNRVSNFLFNGHHF